MLGPKMATVFTVYLFFEGTQETCVHEQIHPNLVALFAHKLVRNQLVAQMGGQARRRATSSSASDHILVDPPAALRQATSNSAAVALRLPNSNR
jgi:hypothetical protein